MLGLALWLLTVGLPSALADETAGVQTISIERGIEKFITFDFQIRRLSIGSAQIADVSVIDSTNLRVLGLVAGRTNFSVWRDGSAVPLTYDVTVTEDISALRDRISTNGDAESVRLSEVGGKIVLEGRFGDAAAQSDARELAKFVTGKDVLDLSGVTSQESVQVEVEVITVSRSALRGLGFNFGRLDQEFSFISSAPNTLGPFTLNPNGQARLDASVAVPIASAFNLLLASPRYGALGVISALEGSNYAQTLARPTLVVRSGEKAQFLVGGEIPIPVPQGAATTAITIEYKRFGVSLFVEPRILKDRRVELKIKPVVSELDFANAIAVQGFSIPAIRTRETETTVEVGENEPFIIAGLLFEGGNSFGEKMPYLANIPVLGRLFQRARETREEQELVVVVTPRLVTGSTQDRTQWDGVRADFSRNASTLPAIPAEQAAGAAP